MKIVKVFHGKVGGGYLTQFYPPVGPVTYLAITQDKDGNFKFVVAEGENQPGPIFTFGDTNMRTKFSIPCREFVNRWSEAGPTHHMAAAAGRHIDTILKVAKTLNVPVDIIPDNSICVENAYNFEKYVCGREVADDGKVRYYHEIFRCRICTGIYQNGR